MTISIPTFIPKFPYVQFKEVSIFEGKTVYEKYTVGTEGELLDWQKELIVKNRQLLLDNQVPINKIRFVFQPHFTYDINKNAINPKYEVMLPFDDSTGKFKKSHPKISIGKPEKLIVVPFHTYKVDDNYEFIKHLVKKTKRGIVIFIADDITILNHRKEPYHFSVDSEYIRLINLDIAIEYSDFNSFE